MLQRCQIRLHQVCTFVVISCNHAEFFL